LTGNYAAALLLLGLVFVVLGASILSDAKTRFWRGVGYLFASSGAFSWMLMCALVWLTVVKRFTQ
jgi:hypothetical protein